VTGGDWRPLEETGTEIVAERRNRAVAPEAA
jgi:hypothetical protein